MKERLGKWLVSNFSSPQVFQTNLPPSFDSLPHFLYVYFNFATSFLLHRPFPLLFLQPCLFQFVFCLVFFISTFLPFYFNFITFTFYPLNRCSTSVLAYSLMFLLLFQFLLLLPFPFPLFSLSSHIFFISFPFHSHTKYL